MTRKHIYPFIVILLLFLISIPVSAESVYIQLEGELFEDVQMSGIFPDSKTFVDCIPVGNPEKILEKYKKEKNNPDFDLKAFVENNFIIPEVKNEKADLPDGLSMEDYILNLWDFLTRKPDEAVTNSSLIPLPHPYIVPGGRFREIYYWDSYFTSEGLVVSGKIAMVENMSDNFAHLIDITGHIPNGNRLYYESRSQPPFFCSLVRIIAKEKGDEAILKYLPQLEKEYEYWMNGKEKLSKENPAYLKVVMLSDGSILNRYYDEKCTPREESYREDIELCEKVKPKNKEKFYRDIRSAAESGWDFSSRWFRDNQNMTTIRTTEIIPVDLNSILYDMEMKLAYWNKVAGNTEKVQKYTEAAEKRKKAINKYCWEKSFGFFFDYCFTDKCRTDTWSLAGAYPLFFNIATQGQADKTARIIKNKFLYEGGLVTTLSTDTGQQWDKPNGWAPLQWIAIKGLENYGHQDIGDEISDKFISAAKEFYNKTKKMVEKYNVCESQASAGGGEYELQEGFGWTNGVIIKLLQEQKETK